MPSFENRDFVSLRIEKLQGRYVEPVTKGFGRAETKSKEGTVGVSYEDLLPALAAGNGVLGLNLVDFKVTDRRALGFAKRSLRSSDCA